MTDARMYLRKTEAAVVSDVPIRNIDRVVDEHIVPEPLINRDTRRARLFSIDACMLIAFYYDNEDILTSKIRVDIIRAFINSHIPYLNHNGEMRNKMTAHSLVYDANMKTMEICIRKFDEKTFPALKVDLNKYVARISSRLELLTEAKNMVDRDSEILKGLPVIKGTRVPVYDVAASVDKGISEERILLAYPTIKPEHVKLAKIYADAVPLKGRPPTDYAKVTRGAKAVSKHVKAGDRYETLN